MQITILFTSMLATMDQMGTVVSLRTVPLEKLLLVNSWIYQDQRDCQDTQRGVPYPTALWQMRHSPSGWISCNPTPIAKSRTGCPMINPFSTRGTSKRTRPLWMLHNKMDAPIALFPANLCSITNKQVILFVDLH